MCMIIVPNKPLHLKAFFFILCISVILIQSVTVTLATDVVYLANVQVCALDRAIRHVSRRKMAHVHSVIY